LIDVFVTQGVDKVGSEAWVGGITEDFDDAGLSGGAELEAGGGEGERLLAGIDGLGLGEVESVTPGEDAAGGRGGIAGPGLGEFGGNPVEEGVALEELDVGLNVVGEVVGGFGNRLWISREARAW
jgi:hypothetical protein